MEYQAKSTEKYTPFLYLFQVLQVTLISICKISHQIFYFLLFCVSFYISRHNFSQIIRTSSIIIWQKNFVTNFPFLTDSLKPSHPLNSQNSLSVIKIFCRCSLIAFFFFQNKSLHSHSYQMAQNFWGLHMNHLRIWYKFANLLQYCYKKKDSILQAAIPLGMTFEKAKFTSSK